MSSRCDLETKIQKMLLPIFKKSTVNSSSIIQRKIAGERHLLITSDGTPIVDFFEAVDCW